MCWMTNVHTNDAEFSEHYEAEFGLFRLQELAGEIIMIVFSVYRSFALGTITITCTFTAPIRYLYLCIALS